ncbi:MAG: FAD-binding protein, partial [Victivallales bacterium]|nr:FAD-binding protein [Victivallales bacterium]
MKRAEIITGLRQEFPELFVSEDYTWQKLTTLGIGGNAPVLVEPGNDIELRLLLQWCSLHEVPWLPLGNGSNLVGSDEPYDGIVIRLRRGSFVNISCGRTHFTVGAGVKLRALIRYAAEHGWGGMSRLAGIPGTIGGALRMNAGALGLSISDKTLELFGFDRGGNPWSVSSDCVNWCYHGSDLPDDVIITGAILALDRSDEEMEDWLVNEELARRSGVEPHCRNAGCIFRNPS